ncbi:podocalyxin [Cyprinus carpio]|uniref:Podocalyxin n=1 Tax=Cyprinus carpio TaxID=7962 RepID=A0A9Q9W6S2_CYPCA|nr:podocalyxin [Cyprinus carpio]
MKMAISWTLIVLGTLLQGMQCNANDNSTAALNGTTLSTVVATTADSTKSTVPLTSLSSTKPTTSSASLESTTPVTTLTSLKPSTPSSSPESTTQAPTTKATSPAQTGPSSTVANQDPANNTTSQNVLVTTQITTIQPTTPNAGTTLTTFNNSPQSSPTTLIATDPNQSTTNSNKPVTTTFTKDGTTQLLSTQTSPSAVAKNSELPTTEPDSKSTASQSLGTTKAQTTTASIIPGQRSDEDITTNTPQKIFNYSFDLSNSTEKNVLVQTCKTLGQKMKGNCTVTVEIHDKRLIATVTIDADQKIPPDNYKPTEPASVDNSTLEKQNVNEDTIPDTLIAILASCGALVLILCCFAAYCTYHRRSYRKNQQHLTEELQTVENGYHDNPTLEVMEVQPEMQEKKLTMNREFNDSWIVPIDNLLKEDIPDEEDTHL